MWKRSITLAIAFSLFVLSGWNVAYAQTQGVITVPTTWGGIKTLSVTGTPAQVSFSETPASVAGALVGQRFPQDKLDWLFAQPLSYHLEIAFHVFREQGRTVEQANALVNDLRKELANGAKQPQHELQGSCEQGVEYKTVVRDPVWSYTYTTFQSDRGTEYLFYFSPWWTVDANNIRWAASDAQVQWAIWLRTMWSGVAGHSLCSKPFTLQLGDTTVWAAGGAGRVLAYLYVHHT